MSKLIIMSISAALALTLSAQAAHLTVVTTVPELADLARQVGGAHLDVRSLIAAEQDPHFVDAKPGYMRLLHDAQLFIQIGADLEAGWAPAIIKGARNPEILPSARGHLDVSTGIALLDAPAAGADRSMGDVHPYGNPHYLLDPWNGRQAAALIAARLTQLDPEHRADFQSGLALFQRRLDEALFGGAALAAKGAEDLWKLAGENPAALDKLCAQGWWAAMAPLRGAPIVTQHKSWVYFARRFGLRILTELEPKPGIPPTPGHLVQVIRLMQAHQAKIIIIEPWFNAKPAELVAGKLGGVVLTISPSAGEAPESGGYLGMLDRAVRQVAGAEK